jgi:CheY-like chemotaxis protein
MINSSANNLAFEDEIIIEDDVGEPQKVLKKWRVLVVDDDDGVHQSTSFAIRGAKILGKKVDWVHAKSAQEAMDILSIDNGFELAIVDVVMENKHAGLDLAKWMRSRKSLEHTRIMLRPGQPGEVSEESVFDQAGVDDLRLKSELSHLRLISAMTALLRSWTTGIKLSKNAKFMGDLAIKAASMAKARSREELCIRAAQTIEELSEIEGVAVALTNQGQERRWILMEGAITEVENFLKKMGLENWLAQVDLKPGPRQALLVDQGDIQWDFALEIQVGSRWHDKAASKRLAGHLGLSSQYDLKSAQAALKLAVDSNKLVWIDLSQGALRTSGLMGKMVDISKLARQRNAQIGWVIPEDDPFCSIADYEPWLMEMKQAGASIALGGFGLGYSSLSKLGVGAWSVIRLHESLTNIGDSESLGSHAKIVRASLSLCAALGIQAACVMPKNDKARKMIMEMAKQVGCKPLWLGASESHRIESKGG